MKIWKAHACRVLRLTPSPRATFSCRQSQSFSATAPKNARKARAFPNP